MEEIHALSSMAAAKPNSTDTTTTGSDSSLKTKVRCNGQLFWLSVDNCAINLEHVGKASKRHSIQKLPICEILSIKFANTDDPDDENNAADHQCVSCASRSNKNDRRTLSSRDIARVSIADPNKKRSIADPSDHNRVVVCVERETDALSLFYVRRKADHFWRVDELTLHFDLSAKARRRTTATTIEEKNLTIDGGDGGGSAIFDTSASVTAAEFLRAIRQKISECPRPKHLLIVINPFGGKGRAVQLYEEHAVSVLDLCGITADVLKTERANHANEYCAEEDLSKYDGVIAVGGDGLFNEVLNGLVIRKQRDHKIDINDRKAELEKPGITIGLIGAGSTNSLAFTVHGTDDPLTSILHIAIGDRRGIDVCGVYDEHQFLRFASTAVSYGFLGDLLKESERLRRFGPPRYVMSGVKTWMRNSYYGGVVKYKTRFGSKHDGNAKNLKMKPCSSNCNLCADDEDENAVDKHHCKNSGKKKQNAADRRARAAANDLFRYQSVLKRQESSSTLNGGEDGGEEWNDTTNWSITDDFTHVVCVVTPCLCKIAPKGISPACHLGDGYMHLALISRLGRFQNLNILGQIMSKNVDHTRHRRFRYFEVKEFSFTPKLFARPQFTQSTSDVLNSTPRHNSVDLGESAFNNEHHGEGTTKDKGSRSVVARSKSTSAIKEPQMGGWNIDGELLAQPEGTVYFRVHRQLITLFARGIEYDSV